MDHWHRALWVCILCPKWTITGKSGLNRTAESQVATDEEEENKKSEGVLLDKSRTKLSLLEKLQVQCLTRRFEVLLMTQKAWQKAIRKARTSRHSTRQGQSSGCDQSRVSSCE